MQNQLPAPGNGTATMLTAFALTVLLYGLILGLAAVVSAQVRRIAERREAPHADGHAATPAGTAPTTMRRRQCEPLAPPRPEENRN